MQEEKQKISPIKQRILKFVDTLGISKRDFYARTGISRGTLESATGITEDTIAKVFATYPSLSPSWLILGMGEMPNYLNDGEINCNLNCNPNCNPSQEKPNTHLNTHPNTHLSNEKSVDEDLFDRNSKVDGQDKTLKERTPIDLELASIKMTQAKIHLPNLLDNESPLSVPFYNLPVSAGSLGILECGASINIPPSGYLNLPVFRGCEFIFPIIGVSMEPLVCSGDWIGVKSIDNLSRNWDFIQTGVVYLVITREDRMIKFIEKTEDEDFIICSSPNYNPFKVHKGDILNIYRVKAIVRGM